MRLRTWLVPGLYLGILILWVFFSDDLIRLLSPWLPARAVVHARTPLFILAWQHLGIVAVSTSLAVLTAFFLGFVVYLGKSGDLKSLVLAVASVSETIPSAAVIALAVPVLGYGNGPCMLALYLYAILPVVRNTIVGLDSVPRPVKEAAEGIGMTRLQQLLRIDLPLAKPVLAAGIRTALIINISAATIGATVGAGGLGVPIVAGIRIYDPVMVLQGSVPVMLMALLADRVLRTRV